MKTLEGIEFALVCASTFQMGSTPGQPDEGYGELEVTLTHDYFVGVTEVTQAQFDRRVSNHDSTFTSCGTDCPVETVTWHESAEFANALSIAAGLAACYTCAGSGATAECYEALNPYDCEGYRLLTEAEWEGAARCGTDLEWAGSNSSGNVAWTSENAGAKTHPSADLTPNACGIHDMSGNVWEWVHDRHGDYGSEATSDPSGPTAGADRVARGGGFNTNRGYATVSYRDASDPEVSSNALGLRLGRTDR